MTELAGLAGDAAPAPRRVLSAADPFEDEEFAFPNGIANGIKCCTKCGATKTPQWREGPFGPKTLCNACGVKRTRKLRAEQEGAKRRKLSASPAPPPPLKHAYASAPKYTSSRAAQYSQDAPAMDSYGSLEPDSEAWGLPAGAAARRPPRRAAEEAAFKTARYARTGEWLEGQDEEGAGYDVPLRAATPSSSSDGYSLPSSNCPEEVSWPPLAGEGANGSAATAHARGSDCFAAINLMTMTLSASQTAAGAGAASSGANAAATAERRPAACPASPASAFVPLSAALDAEQINHDCLAAMAARYDGQGQGMGASRPHRVAPVDLAELSACLPPAKVLELVRLNQELEMAVHEAHAANAAVAAVAQVLAAKQAAALRSRDAAGAATKRLRRFMAELDTQFGIQSKFGSRRPPLSPSKPTAIGGSAAGVPPAPVELPSAVPLSPAVPILAPLLPAAPALQAGTL